MSNPNKTKAVSACCNAVYLTKIIDEIPQKYCKKCGQPTTIKVVPVMHRPTKKVKSMLN